MRSYSTHGYYSCHNIVSSLGNRTRYAKIVLAIAAVLALLLVTGLLLSLIKHTNIRNLAVTDKRLYHNGQTLTVLMGEVFDLKNYNRYEVSVVSPPIIRFHFNATVCQAQCSPGKQDVINPIDLDYSGMLNISSDLPREYLQFSNEPSEYTPSLYMLKESKTVFKFEKLNVTAIDLNIFNNTELCELFFFSPHLVPTEKYELQTLSVVNNFTVTYTTESDAYICIVATLLEEGVYHYSVKGLVSQYHSVSYLIGRDMCKQNYSLIRNSDGNSAELQQSISRPSDSLVSLQAQRMCILVTVEGYCKRTNCGFNVTGSIFGTKSNPSVITTSVAAVFVFILLSLFLVCLCVLHYPWLSWMIVV